VEKSYISFILLQKVVVRSDYKTTLGRKGVLETTYLGFLRKCVEMLRCLLKSDQNNCHLTWILMYVYDSTSQWVVDITETDCSVWGTTWRSENRDISWSYHKLSEAYIRKVRINVPRDADLPFSLVSILV